MIDLFLHIPKTAGTTIHEIALRHYPPGKALVIGGTCEHTEENFGEISQRRRDGYRYVGGHFSYGFHRHFTKPCRYVTMLRDPLDAALSLYLYIKHCEAHPFFNCLKDEHLSFIQWIRHPYYGHLDNHQLRWLTGEMKAATINRDLLEHGKHLLLNEFAIVGLVDRFDESMLFFQDALGWQDLFYVPRNVCHTQADGDLLTDEARSAVAAAHGLSYELLEFARELFDCRVWEAGPRFTECLARFKEGNARWAMAAG